MNKKLKGIGKLVGKATAIIGTAGAASLLSDMFLFGGKLTADSDDDEDKVAKTEEITETEETEHVNEEDVIVEDNQNEEREDE